MESQQTSTRLSKNYNQYFLSFHKTKTEEIRPNSFYEASSKYNQKQNCRPVSLMDKEEKKTSIKHYRTKHKHIIKIIDHDQILFIPERVDWA